MGKNQLSSRAWLVAEYLGQETARRGCFDTAGRSIGVVGDDANCEPTFHLDDCDVVLLLPSPNPVVKSG